MIWAWLGAAVVGLSLGLLGSGGAILTVPILVYLVGHNEKSAIVESLAIVGAIAVAGVVRAAMQKRVDYRSAALLAFPGIAGTLAGATIAQSIPGAVQLIILAALMLTASALMYSGSSGTGRSQRPGGAGPGSADRPAPPRARSCPLWLIGVQGFGLGLATGLVGVGGGFLIVPVLVLLRRLPMPTAIGTSLAIISVNCAVGLFQYILLVPHTAATGGRSVAINWEIVGVFAALGVAGSLVGNALAGTIPQGTLKRIFAVFLVVMAGYITVRQAPRVLPGVFGEAAPAEAAR